MINVWIEFVMPICDQESLVAWMGQALRPFGIRPRRTLALSTCTIRTKSDPDLPPVGKSPLRRLNVATCPIMTMALRYGATPSKVRRRLAIGSTRRRCFRFFQRALLLHLGLALLLVVCCAVFGFFLVFMFAAWFWDFSSFQVFPVTVSWLSFSISTKSSL